MTRLRQTIARRLYLAQDTAAMLTTFNDVDTTAVIERAVAMAICLKRSMACAWASWASLPRPFRLALKDIPAVNGRIDGDEIVYNNYMDIRSRSQRSERRWSPVIRNAESLSSPPASKDDRRGQARQGRHADDGLRYDRGTFTISNGGVFGSLMSTPIINCRNRPCWASIASRIVRSRSMVRSSVR